MRALRLLCSYVDRVVSGIKQQLSSIERLERAQVEHEVSGEGGNTGANQTMRRTSFSVGAARMLTHSRRAPFLSSQSRRGELARITSRSSHELATLVAQCRTLKGHIESEISALFQNRPVHIVGEINQILQ